MPKPIPVPDEVSKPFWDACNERKLVIQYCAACNRWQHPPAKVCWQCKSGDKLEWRQVSGRGSIYSYHVMYDCRIRSMQPDQPFNIVVVSLEECPEINLITNLPGTPVDEVKIGSKVQLDFVEVGPGRLIPEFREAK